MILNNFISMCQKSNGDYPPDNFTYRDISKVVSERYPTQSVEVVKVFFKSKGKVGNNTPYVYPEELEIGTATQISNDLYDARVNTVTKYGAKPKKDVATKARTQEEQLLDYIHN